MVRFYLKVAQVFDAIIMGILGIGGALVLNINQDTGLDMIFGCIIAGIVGMVLTVFAED